MNSKKLPRQCKDLTNVRILSHRVDIEDEFEKAVKEEVGKLESQMKIGISTLRHEC